MTPLVLTVCGHCQWYSNCHWHRSFFCLCQQQWHYQWQCLKHLLFSAHAGKPTLKMLINFYTLVSWALWCLATHPQIQERVYQELIQHFGDSDSEFCTKKLKDLKYFEQCVKETLRIYPPTAAILRKLNNEIQMCGQTIPKGATITIPIFIIHRNPRVSVGSLCIIVFSLSL